MYSYGNNFIKRTLSHYKFAATAAIKVMDAFLKTVIVPGNGKPVEM